MRPAEGEPSRRFWIQVGVDLVAVVISLIAAFVAWQAADTAKTSAESLEDLESGRRKDEVFVAERVNQAANYWAPGECADKAEMVSLPMKHFYGEDPPSNKEDYIERCNRLLQDRTAIYAVREIEIFGTADTPSSLALIELDYSADDPLRTKDGQATVTVEFDNNGKIISLDEVVDRSP